MQKQLGEEKEKRRKAEEKLEPTVILAPSHPEPVEIPPLMVSLADWCDGERERLHCEVPTVY